jgi:hypothetical protein
MMSAWAINSCRYVKPSTSICSDRNSLDWARACVVVEREREREGGGQATCCQYLLGLLQTVLWQLHLASCINWQQKPQRALTADPVSSTATSSTSCWRHTNITNVARMEHPTNSTRLHEDRFRPDRPCLELIPTRWCAFIAFR